MSLSFQPVQVATGYDAEGMLVFDGNQQLVAVLTHLSEENEIAPGQWFLEAGFGRLDVVHHPTFANLDAAEDWMRQRLSLSGAEAARRFRKRS